MARGYFSGLVWGGAAAVAGLAVLSLVAPLPQSPAAVTKAPDDVVATPDQIDAGAGLNGAGRDADLVELPPTAPAKADADHDTLDPLTTADTEPAAVPLVDDAGQDLAKPEAEAAANVDASQTPDATPQTPAPDVLAAAAPDAQPETQLNPGPASVTLSGQPQADLRAPDAADGPTDRPTAELGLQTTQPAPSPTSPAAADTTLSISTEPAQPAAPMLRRKPRLLRLPRLNRRRALLSRPMWHR